MKSLGWFAAAFALTLGPLIAAAPSWAWFATPPGTGALLLSIGGVLAAAFGVDRSAVVAKITGNGKQPLPPDVN